MDGPSDKNITVTSGEWEVRTVLAVDKIRQCIYYTSTEVHSTESHVYNVSYATMEKHALTDISKPGFWSAKFSPARGWYTLRYAGPGDPHSASCSINSSEPTRVGASQLTVQPPKAIDMPTIEYFEIELVPDTNYTLNVQAQYPPGFDPSKKYQVLFNSYGGPSSQDVTKQLQLDPFRTYISSDPELQYIIYVVDPRGTGYKGRAFRSTVAGQLGLFDAHDQIWAADHLIAKNSFIDSNHVAIWGSSYGGYLAAKVIESQGSHTGPFTLGLSASPVTDWDLYHAEYER